VPSILSSGKGLMAAQASRNM